jgi:hypothetical protein
MKKENSIERTIAMFGTDKVFRTRVEAAEETLKGVAPLACNSSLTARF